MSETMLNLEDFNQYAENVGNRYDAINKIAKKSRSIKTYLNNRISESESITCAVTDKIPEFSKHEVSIPRLYKYDELSHVCDNEIIDCVLRSISVSTKNNTYYIYSDELDEYKKSRVRVLVNMIMNK